MPAMFEVSYNNKSHKVPIMLLLYTVAKIVMAQRYIFFQLQYLYEQLVDIFFVYIYVTMQFVITENVCYWFAISVYSCVMRAIIF